MNYYKRHLGDYAKDTKHLTTYQHGVYAVLLDWYYASEKPIPVALAYRIVQARSGPEKKAVDEVLDSCFDLCKAPGFAHNKRADIDIAKYQCKSEANSLIAQDREITKRARSVIESCGIGSTNDQPSHKPVTNSHKEAEKQSASPDGEAPLLTKSDPIPYERIKDLFNATMTRLAKVRELTTKRRALIRSAWHASTDRRSADFWQAYFEECEADPFLNGTGPYRPPHEGWRPSFDYLLKPDVITRTYEKALDHMERRA